MTGLAPVIVLMGAGLAAVIAFELVARPTAAIDPVLPASQVAAIDPPVPKRPTEAESAAQVDTLLARPLFSQTRRSSVAEASSPPVAVPLPRLTGILIDGPSRVALFAAQTGVAGGKPTAITEGGVIGPFTVRTIGSRQVTIAGLGGEHTMRTSFDPNLQPAPPPTPAPVPYKLDAPKILNIPPGPSLLSRSLPFHQDRTPNATFGLPQAGRR